MSTRSSTQKRTATPATYARLIHSRFFQPRRRAFTLVPFSGEAARFFHCHQPMNCIGRKYRRCKAKLPITPLSHIRTQVMLTLTTPNMNDRMLPLAQKRALHTPITAPPAASTRRPVLAPGSLNFSAVATSTLTSIPPKMNALKILLNRCSVISFQALSILRGTSCPTGNLL